jgi:hypothetical protein
MSNKEICHDLTNLKYKTLLNRKSKLVIKSYNEDNKIEFIDKLLENEKNINMNVSWNKLDKTIKLKYLNDFVNNITKYKLTTNEKQDLKKYLIILINKKQLQKKSDVLYDNIKHIIIDIPIIQFNKETRKFKQKRNENRTSTMSSLTKTKLVSKKTR